MAIQTEQPVHGIVHPSPGLVSEELNRMIRTQWQTMHAFRKSGDWRAANMARWALLTTLTVRRWARERTINRLTRETDHG